MPAPTAVTIPDWSTPLYHPAPHHFRDCTRVMLLCGVPEGVTRRLLPEPLEPIGDFVVVSWLLIGDVDGYKGSHNVAFNVPCRFEEHVGKFCSLEYIDIDMGLAAGREMWPWPKKGGEFTWERTPEGLSLACRRHGDVLVRSEITVTGEPAGAWPAELNVPDMGPCNLQVRLLAQDHASEPEIAQVIRVDYPNSVLHGSLRAEGTLTLTDGPRDPFGPLGDIRVLAARLDTQEFDFDLGQVVGSRRI
ncbi:acetoacetate decarboxylase [Nonomuraea thailandensis]|uniref:Acetoacetate decarboxylase n=1 Tax=Nonomuraea thailandensis TaxID=1188745 RepID=A0A9X2GFR5_9ACTN|nr:acetoacetate decarboxylase family protein [Nonomuraea thailandensis]MCP2358086.1 acetoacetate decarboxylase [Nonomuraea thailandensis]